MLPPGTTSPQVPSKRLSEVQEQDVTGSVSDCIPRRRGLLCEVDWKAARPVGGDFGEHKSWHADRSGGRLQP